MKQARKWFAARDLDWNDFVANGIAAEDLLRDDDGAARIVVEAARGEG